MYMCFISDRLTHIYSSTEPTLLICYLYSYLAWSIHVITVVKHVQVSTVLGHSTSMSADLDQAEKQKLINYFLLRIQDIYSYGNKDKADVMGNTELHCIYGIRRQL